MRCGATPSALRHSASLARRLSSRAARSSGVVTGSRTRYLATARRLSAALSSGIPRIAAARAPVPGRRWSASTRSIEGSQRHDPAVDVPHRHRGRHGALHVEQRESERRREERVCRFTDIMMMNQVRNTIGHHRRCARRSRPREHRANTGSTIRQISIQSKKKPRMNTSTIRKISTSHRCPGPRP